MVWYVKKETSQSQYSLDMNIKLSMMMGKHSAYHSLTPWICTNAVSAFWLEP